MLRWKSLSIILVTVFSFHGADAWASTSFLDSSLPREKLHNFRFEVITTLGSMKQQQKRCADKGGRLAVIPDDDVQRMIMGLYLHNDAYIGMTDMKKEGTFVWFGNYEILDRQKTLWKTGEPNNYNGNEDCVSVLKRRPGWSDKFQLNDIWCDAQLHAICELNPATATSKDLINGAILKSPFVTGAILIKKEPKPLEDGTFLMVITGDIEKAASVSEDLAVIYIRRKNASEPLCGNPTPFMQLYKQHIMHKTFKEVDFLKGTQPTLTLLTSVKGTDFENDAVVLREIGTNPREIGCAPFKAHRELDWFKAVSNTDAAGSTGTIPTD